MGLVAITVSHVASHVIGTVNHVTLYSVHVRVWSKCSQRERKREGRKGGNREEVGEEEEEEREREGGKEEEGILYMYMYIKIFFLYR